MIEAADRVSLVADSSKFGQRALSYLCPLTAVHEVVTDDGLSDEWHQRLGANGIAVELVAGSSKAAEVQAATE